MAQLSSDERRMAKLQEAAFINQQFGAGQLGPLTDVISNLSQVANRQQLAPMIQQELQESIRAQQLRNTGTEFDLTQQPALAEQDLTRGDASIQSILAQTTGQENRNTLQGEDLTPDRAAQRERLLGLQETSAELNVLGGAGPVASAASTLNLPTFSSSDDPEAQARAQSTSSQNAQLAANLIQRLQEIMGSQQPHPQPTQ